MRVTYEHLTRAELDEQLSPSRSAKDPWGVLARHESISSGLVPDRKLIVTRDHAYGPGERQRFDLYRPTVADPVPCLVYIHGGFWQEGAKAGSGFAAPNLARLGWATVGLGYTLAPDATLAAIIDDVDAGLTAIWHRTEEFGIDRSRVVVAGHSAGAHLLAALMAGLGRGSSAHVIAAALLMSGVYDLAPIAASYVNDAVGMDERAVADLSPLLAPPMIDVPTRLVIGADEPDAFQRQSDALHQTWSPHLSSLSIERVPGRDHFDILDELADPTSATSAFLAELV